MTSPRVRRQHDSSTRHNGFVFLLPAHQRAGARPPRVGSVRPCFSGLVISHSLSLLISILFTHLPSHIIRHVSCHEVCPILPVSGARAVHGGASAWQLSSLSYLHLILFSHLELFWGRQVESRK